MIEAEPRYRLSKERLTALCQAARDHMPLIAQTLAAEAVARGLGYSDYAKLARELAGAEAIRSVDGSTSGFREFQAAAGLPYSFRGKWQTGAVPGDVQRARA